MSTEAEKQQQATPAAAAESTTAVESVETKTVVTVTNGDSSAEKKNGSAKKEVEPKDPKTETAEWIEQQNKAAIHKANHDVLDWIITEAYTEEEKDKKPVLPKSGFVTKKEFVEYFKDGVLLARFANKLKPGAVESVKEGEEAKTAENQKANVDGFLAFAKEHLNEDQLFTSEDLEKGKESYLKVFVALFQLAYKIPEAFQRSSFDFEKFFTELATIVPKSFVQKFKENFTNFAQTINAAVRRPFTRSPSNVGAEQNGAAAPENGVNGTSETAAAATTEEHTGQNGNVVEKKTVEEAHAVAAN